MRVPPGQIPFIVASSEPGFRVSLMLDVNAGSMDNGFDASNNTRQGTPGLGKLREPLTALHHEGAHE